MATLAPLAASFRAIPLPIPRELPVISACFPFRDISTSLSVRSNETEISHGRVSWQTHWTYFAMGRLAYVKGVADGRSLRSELRGRFWSNHFGWQSLFDVGHAPSWEHWTKSRPADQSLTGHPMSFDRLKRTQGRKRLPGHKLKPSRATLFVQNSKPHLSMKQTYILAIDVAKHKVRAALSGADERLLFEKDLPV